MNSENGTNPKFMFTPGREPVYSTNGMNAQQAVDAPRSSYGPGTYSFMAYADSLLELDYPVEQKQVIALETKGHVVKANSSGSFGGSDKMIQIDKHTGVMSGGFDRRSGGLAGGI